MGIPVSEFGMQLHWLHVLGQVQEQGPADAVPDNSEGSPWALCAPVTVGAAPHPLPPSLSNNINREDKCFNAWTGGDDAVRTAPRHITK